MNPGIHYNSKFLTEYQPIKLHFHYSKQFLPLCFFLHFCCSERGRRDTQWLRIIYLRQATY